MPDTSLVDRLAALPQWAGIDRAELEWLAAHGTLRTCPAGGIMAPKGEPVDTLWIILAGRVSVSVDRGAGARRVIVWGPGDAAGLLPYSRMSAPPGDNVCELDSELLVVHRDHFREVIERCPAFTEHCVHLMLDRARGFNTSDLQDEKMVSLGRLAAGLAHELNNPASATVRSAKRLREAVAALEASWHALRSTGVSDAALAAIEQAREALCGAEGETPSALERADREDALEEGLARHGLERDLAASLAEAGFTVDVLEDLARAVPPAHLGVALEWVAASSSADALVATIERGAERVYDLVSAVKRFTYMDKPAGPETVDVATGIRDTVRVLASKARGKQVTVTVDMAPDLPPVKASGGELNQVWFNLIDNALDAVAASGHVTVTGANTANGVIVEVIDDGPGVPAHLADRIFDTFFTTKPPGQGTGLGLDIARRLIRRYNGDLTLESAPGRTVFRAKLLPAPTPAAVEQS